MKRGVAVLILVTLLIFPLVQAQEYSNFNRFTDNLKLFFSFGDTKVKLALEIREKEINSAIENIQNRNTEEADKNLQNAWKKLQIVQEKVSLNNAGEITQNSNEIRNKIKNENLTDEFEVYILEEEKTGLTAEWVIEKNGPIGQNATNQIDANGTIGQTRVQQIEERIVEIDNSITEWVVENSVAGDNKDNGLTWEIKTEISKGDNGLKREVKTSVAGDGTLKNDPLPVPDLNAINPDLVTKDTTKNEVVQGDGGEGYASGTTADGGDCGEGVVCGGENDVIENIEGTPGTNDVAPAVDSNEGDEE